MCELPRDGSQGMVRSESFKQVEKAFFDASKEGGFFYNLMIKQSKTLTGRWSNLQDSMTIFLSGLGDAIEKALQLKKVVGFLTRKIEEWGEASSSSLTAIS